MPKTKSEMFKCTLCSKRTTSISDFLDHVKAEHKESDTDEHQCPLCHYSFDQLWKLGRHLSTCVQNNSKAEMSSTVFLQTRFEYIAQYRKLIQDIAFDFALGLAKNMNVPRNAVFEVIENVKKLLRSIGACVKEVVNPLLKEDKMHEFENVIWTMINDSFENVETEHKFDKRLSVPENQLISAIKQVKLEDASADGNDSELNETGSDVDVNDGRDGNDINNEDEENGCDDIDSDGVGKSRLKSVTLMDIQFQMKKFFELPGVFNKVMLNTEKIKKNKKLNHYINGTSWKNKLKNFSKEDIVIPYHLHIDDTQTNNSLGTHAANGDQTCVYYTFPTIPNEFLARLDTIFAGMFFESSLSKKHGNEKCYEALVDELNKLADDGITLNIDGKEQKVYFVMGLLLGDNKGLNECLGFVKGFRANYYCRHCRLHRTQMQYSYEEDNKSLRNIQNYYEDLEIGDASLTGVCENSPFNRIRFFHATDCCADVMHDINEGILHYNVSEIILHFMKKKYFTLNQLNDEKLEKNYGELENNNKSSKIKMKDLRRKKLKMTASESHSFVHHLPFLLLNLRNENRQEMESDEVWQFLLVTIRFLDMCYMTEFEKSSLKALGGVTAAMHEMYVRLFNQTLKPKHHFATHYPSLIKKFGPIRFLSSMRFEANHRFVKNYTKNTGCRKNLSYSIGRKLQYNFAFFLKSANALQDKFETFRPKLTRIIDEAYFPSMIPSIELKSMSTESIHVCDKVKLNGLTLSSKLNLPYLNKNNEMNLLKIVKIILNSTGDITSVRVIYQKYEGVSYRSDCASYTVQNLLSEMHLLNINEIISQRMFPVVLHDVAGLKMFRYKTF